MARWTELIRCGDAVWPIAPESGGVLARISELAVDAGPHALLGSHPRSVRPDRQQAGDGEGTCRWPELRSVPTASARKRCEIFASGSRPGSSNPTMVRARQTRCCSTPSTRRDRWLAANAGTHTSVVQPYVERTCGQPVDALPDGRGWLLTCNRADCIEIDRNAFRYRGVVVGGREARRAAYQPIAAAVAAAIPGLWGYVGIDFIDSADGPLVLGDQPTADDVLCRSRSARSAVNPASLVLDLLNREIPEDPAAAARDAAANRPWTLSDD